MVRVGLTWVLIAIVSSVQFKLDRSNKCHGLYNELSLEKQKDTSNGYKLIQVRKDLYHIL